MSHPNYEWGDLNEKEDVLQKLYTSDIIAYKEAFNKLLLGNAIADEDTRYLVWARPVRVQFDPENQDGAKGPLEAIQMALELHVDGGWDWLVWDQKQNVGFGISSNTYIYAPLDRHYHEHFGPDGFKHRSSQYLREVINKAQEILQKRERDGTL